MRSVVIAFLLTMIISMQANAAILIESSDGSFVSSPAIATMAQACKQSRPIHITSAISGAFANISSATGSTCTPPIIIHSGGSLAPTTTFRVPVNVGMTTAPGTPRIFYGDNTPSGDNSAILIGRKVQGAGLFSHAVRDESTFNSTSTGAYASFDAIPVMIGATDYNHFTAFQSRPFYNGSGILNTYQAFVDEPTFNGHVSTRIAFRAEEVAGIGSIDGDNIGLLVDPLTKGVGTNYAIRTDGSTPSLFGGIVTAANFGSHDGFNSESFGVGAGPAGSNFLGTFMGHSAGRTASGTTSNTFFGAFSGDLNGNGGFNTYLGSQTGRNNIGANNNVFIGFMAGSNQFTSNKLFIDALSRGTAEAELTNSLIVGTFAANTVDQNLTVNGGFTLGTTTAAPTCSSTIRGEFWYVPGGTGTKDSVQVCAKDGANAYAWRMIY